MTDPIKRIGFFFLIAIIASNSDAFWFRGNSTSSLWSSWLPFTYNLTSEGMGQTGSLTLTIKPRNSRHVRDLWDDRQSRFLKSFISNFNTSNSALFDTDRWQASGLAVTLGSVVALSATVWAIIGKAIKFRKANETGLIDPNLFGRPFVGSPAPPPSPYAPQLIPPPPSYPSGYFMVPAPPSYDYGDSKPPKRNPFKGYTKAFKEGVKEVQDFFNAAVPDMVQNIPAQFKAIRDSIPIPNLKDMRQKGMNKKKNRRPMTQSYYPYYPPVMRDNPYSYGVPPPNYGPPPPSPPYAPNYGPPPPPPTYAPPPPPPPPPTYAPPPPPPTYAPPTYAPPPPPPTYAPLPPPPPPTYAPPPPPPTFRPVPLIFREPPPPPPPPPPTPAPYQPPRTPWAPPPPQLPPPARVPVPLPSAPSPFEIIPPPLNGSPPVTPTIPPEPFMSLFGSASENDVSVLNSPPIRPSPIDPMPFVPSMPWPQDKENTIADPSAPRLPQWFWARNRAFLPNRDSKADDSELEVTSTSIPSSTSSSSTLTTMASEESTTSSSSTQFTPYVIRVEDPDMNNSTTTSNP